MAYYIGLDLGGTNLKAGIVDSDANVQVQISVPTEAEKGPDRVMTVMAEAARKVAQQADLGLDQVSYIGIGAPGPLDLKAGTVMNAPNMPHWKNVPLRDRIAQETGRPTALENDANAAAFGEYWAGAGRGESIQHLVMLTLGTGIGSGVIVAGKLVHGATGVGGEGGHLIVQPGGRLCGCGQRGCLEAYASASHTARRAKEALETGRTSSLSKLQLDGRPITAQQVFAAAGNGDALAQQIIDETAEYLGIACVSLCRLLDPQMIVFAGGMTLAGPALFDKVRASYNEHNWAMTESSVQIVPAALGNDAGFIGAAAIAWNADQSGS